MPADDAAAALVDLDRRRPAYLKARDYIHGQFPIVGATPKFLEFFEEVIEEFQLNLCEPTVDTYVEKCGIDTWEGDGAEQAAKWWDEGPGKRLQNEVTAETVGIGDGYLLAWPNRRGERRLNVLRADEATVVHADDDPDDIELSLKVWAVADPDDRTRQLTRLNVYYDDRVERWLTRQQFAKGWGDIDETALQPFDGDGEPPVIGHDFGENPMVHFPGKPDKWRTGFGRSVLSAAMPVQDRLNKHVIDIVIGSEQYAFPLRVLLAYATDVDPETGKAKNLPDVNPLLDHFLAFRGEKTDVKQLPPGDMEAVLKIKEDAARDMAAVTKVPVMRYVHTGAQVPSGEALRIVESPLDAAVETFNQNATPAWQRATRLLGFEARPTWSDPMSMDVSETWGLVQAKIDAGWPARQAYIEAGMSPDFVDRTLSEAANQQQSFADMLVRAEREGRDPAALLNGR